MAKIKGSDLILFIQKDGKYKAYAYSTTCEIDIQADTIEVGSPDTGQWVRKKKRKISWRVSSGYLMSDGSASMEIFKTLIDKSPIMITLGSVRSHTDVVNADEYENDGRLTMQGEGLLTRMTVTGRKGDFVTMSMEIEGCGKLEMIWEPKITIEPESASDEGIAGESKILITGNIDYDISSDSRWLTVSKREGKMGVTEVAIHYEANDGEVRVGKISAIGKYPYESTTAEFVFTQRVHPSKFLIIEPTSLDINGHGDEKVIKISGYRAWVLIYKPEWITVTPDNGGSISGEYEETDVVVKADINYEGDRDGRIEFITYDAYLGKTVDVAQERYEYVSVDPKEVRFLKSGGEEKVELVGSSSWYIEDKPEWITVAPSSGDGSSVMLNIVSGPNDENERRGSIVFRTDTGASSEIGIVQMGVGVDIVVTPETLEFPEDGGIKYAILKAGHAWSVSSDVSFAESISPRNGDVGMYKIAVTIPANMGERRTGEYKITDANTGYVAGLNIIQEEKNVILSVSPKDIVIPQDGSPTSITVNSNTSWTAI